MKLVYFAWIKEQLGLSEEVIDLPSDIRTVADILVWFQNRGGRFGDAFADLSVVHVAIDQEYANPEDDITVASEIAFFPPVTGG